MKTFNKILLALLAIFLIVSCQDLEDLNKIRINRIKSLHLPY